MPYVMTVIVVPWDLSKAKPPEIDASIPDLPRVRRVVEQSLFEIKTAPTFRAGELGAVSIGVLSDKPLSSGKKYTVLLMLHDGTDATKQHCVHKVKQSVGIFMKLGADVDLMVPDEWRPLFKDIEDAQKFVVIPPLGETPAP